MQCRQLASGGGVGVTSIENGVKLHVPFKGMCVDNIIVVSPELARVL